MRFAAAAASRRDCMLKLTVMIAAGSVIATSAAVIRSTTLTQPEATNQVPTVRLTSRTNGAEIGMVASASVRSIGCTQAPYASPNPIAAFRYASWARPACPKVLTTEIPETNSTIVALIRAMPWFISAIFAVMSLAIVA